MDLGMRILAICLAALLAAGLFPLPEPPPPPPRPPIELPAPPGVGIEDVSPDDWFYEYIRIGYRYGFLQGTHGRFEPNRAVTRAEFITMLGRLHSALGGHVIHDGPFDNPFSDTRANAFYFPYLLWAAELRIVEGDEQNRFRPNERLRREEMAVILVHYIYAYALDTHFDETDEEREPYADWEEIAVWAYFEAHLIRDFGLMHDIHESVDESDLYRFRPEAPALRAEVAVIFARIFTLVSDATVAV